MIASPACLLILASLAASAASSDLEELGRRSMRANEANGVKQQQYAFREDKIQVVHDNKGKETDRETWTWDVIGLEGSTYKKLVLHNGKPLSPKEQKQEDDKMKREAQLRREENSGRKPHRLFSFSYSFGIPYDRLVDLYDLKSAGEEELAGRHTVILIGSPKEGVKPKNDQEKESLNYSLKLWLEDSEAFPVRIDSEVTGDHSRMQKGTRIRIDFLRLNDAWLPATMTFGFSARVMKMFTIQGTAAYTYSDYHKFQVDSNIVALPDK